MLLSTQLFDRIVGMAEVGAEDRKATVLPVGCRRAPERRRTTRLAYGRRTLISCDRGKKAGVWDTVMLQDISGSGIGYLSHSPMSVGDTFVLKLSDGAGQIIRIRCKVARCEKGGFGQTSFKVGANFEQFIQQQVLHVNDEEGDERVSTEHQEDSVAEQIKVIASSETSGLVSRAFRMVSQLIHKADDFSSLG